MDAVIRFLRRNPSLAIALLAFPTREEILAKLETWECVCFGVEDNFIQWKDVVGSEKEVEVFQCFRLSSALAGGFVNDH